VDTTEDFADFQIIASQAAGLLQRVCMLAVIVSK